MTVAETVVLPIASLIRDPDVQAREQLDPQTVQAYAEDMREGIVFPPPDVFTDGHHYWVADGFHRVAAAEAKGDGELAVSLYRGGKREAILHAVGSNCTHGLRRTNADKQRAVKKVLADPAWANESDGWIADKCKVSSAMVRKYRPVSTSPPQGDFTPCEVKMRRGRDGRSTNVAAIGSATKCYREGSAALSRPLHPLNRFVPPSPSHYIGIFPSHVGEYPK